MDARTAIDQITARIDVGNPMSVSELQTLANSVDATAGIRHYCFLVEASSIDILQFTGITYENLWFSRNFNHLQINVVGTNDRVTVSNWYINNAYQLDYIFAGTSMLSNDKLDQLVSVMSQYTMRLKGRIISFHRTLLMRCNLCFQRFGYS